MGFEEIIKLIENGEKVAAGTPNRPLRSLEQNVRYLKAIIDAAETGETVFARDVTLESAASVGMPVYYDGAGSAFRRGLAQTQTDLVTGELLTANSAQVWGVVYQKENSTLGDVLLFGFAALDISAALTETLTSGVYYLSAAAPGGLTSQRPPVTVPVLIADGEGSVLVNPQITDFLHDHVHYKFDLVGLPSGEHSPPIPDGLHTIENADSTIEGWLPADDDIFDGKAPVGALFGYNIAVSSWNNLWPPVPVSAAVLEWDKALDKDLGLIGVSDDLLIMDINGIWWMSNCDGDVPWPADLDTNSSLSLSDGAGECPRNLKFALRLWFNKLSFLTDQSVVTGLVSGDDRIEIVCANDPTTVASTGPLLIRLALEFLIGESGTRGYEVFKAFDEATNKFETGPVIEGLYALSSNVAIAGEASQQIVIGEVTYTVYQGLVGISVAQDASQELQPSVIRLAGATEEFYEEIPYLGFADDELSQIRATIEIPSTLVLSNPKLQIRLRILARAAGTLPTLTINGRSIPRVTVATDLPAPTDVAVPIVTAVAVTADQYLDVDSDEIDVVAGDIYAFTVERGAADGYTGELGLLQVVGIVSQGV
jgi:hypothetical protein